MVQFLTLRILYYYKNCNRNECRALSCIKFAEGAQSPRNLRELCYLKLNGNLKAEIRKWVRTNFQVNFWAHVCFQPTIHRSQNLVDLLPLWLIAMPFCTFGAKRHETEKIPGPDLRTDIAVWALNTYYVVTAQSSVVLHRRWALSSFLLCWGRSKW